MAFGGIAIEVDHVVFIVEQAETHGVFKLRSKNGKKLRLLVARKYDGTTFGGFNACLCRRFYKHGLINTETGPGTFPGMAGGGGHSEQPHGVARLGGTFQTVKRHLVFQCFEQKSGTFRQTMRPVGVGNKPGSLSLSGMTAPLSYHLALYYPDVV